MKLEVQITLEVFVCVRYGEKCIGHVSEISKVIFEWREREQRNLKEATLCHQPLFTLFSSLFALWYLSIEIADVVLKMIILLPQAHGSIEE